MTLDHKTNKAIQGYVQAWVKGDASLLKGCFTENGTYFDGTLKRRISAVDLGKYLEETFQRFPDIEFSVAHYIHTEDGKVGIEWVMSARNLELMFGLPPSDKFRQVTTIDFLTMKDEKLQAVQVYYDMSGFELEDVSGQANKDYEASAKQVEKYKGSGLTEENLQLYKDKLLQAMEQQQLFLDSELTMFEVAEAIGVRPNHLSQIINSQFGLNFFNFVNKYRIDEAKRLLLSDADLSIITVAFDSGFKSASTFYSAFSKFTGTNPNQFRRQNLPG